MNGKEMRAIREAHGLSRQKLAQELEVSISWIALQETRKQKVSPDTEKKLVERYGISH